MSSFENGSSRSLCSSHRFHRRSIFNTDAGGGGGWHLNKFESTLPFGILCWVGLKMAQWFWGRYLNIVNVSSSLSLFPKKSVTLHLKKISLNPECLAASLIGNGLVVLEKNILNFFLEIHHNLPVRRTWPIIWPTWIPFNKRWFMIASNWSSGSWNVDQYVFLLLCIHPSCKKTLNFHYQLWLHASFNWNCSGAKEFLKTMTLVSTISL